MDKTKVNLERLRACDEWEENKHPRADNGQFTSGASSSSGGSKSQVANLTSLKKSGDKATKAAIGILGSDIKSALAAAHSEKGFSSGMLSDAKAATYAKKLSELTGEEFYIDKVTEKGFMGMDFTKPVLKVKPASESPLRKAAETIQGKGGLTGYKGLSFKQETSEADSGTPAGEIHNFLVGYLQGMEPTKENVTAACKLAVNMLNDNIAYMQKNLETAKQFGLNEDVKSIEANIKKHEDRIQAAYEAASGLK